MRVPGIEQAIIPLRLIAQQEQPFRVAVQPADGIGARRKVKFREDTVRWVLLRELGEHTEGFVKGEDHGQKEGRPSRACLRDAV